MNAALSGFMSKEDASILATTNASTTNARALPIVPKFCDALLLGTLLLFALELGFAFQLHDYQLFERIPGKASDVVASWGGQLYFVSCRRYTTLALVIEISPVARRCWRWCSDSVSL